MAEATFAGQLLKIAESVNRMSVAELKAHCRLLTLTQLDALKMAMRLKNSDESLRRKAVSEGWGMPRLVDELMPDL